MGDPDTALATRLPCTFGILTELSTAEIEDLEIEAGEKLCITTKLDSDSFVYVVQIELVSATATNVWMLYPDDPEAGPLPAADRVRVPASDTWIEPQATGKVRALMAPRRLRAVDLSELLGGREPLPGTVSVKNAKTGTSWP
jgi:hypothetical protein